ncbi:MAG: diguanylate cyclase [Campylobacterota bacterium]|nr:diguanylate cyclase [Campylobacterota bacterium]
MQKLSDIFEHFSKLTGYTVGFVKQDNREVLISSGWTDICKTYHRGTDSSAYICAQSNAELTQSLDETKKTSMKQCQHGMVDGATPIIIDGEHLADLFSGQVLFEQPNIEEFKLGAEEFGYDMQKYLKALEDVKVISQEKLQEVLEFLSSIAQLVAELGKDKKEFLRLNAQLEKEVELKVKEEKSLLSLFDKSESVLFKWNNDSDWSVSFVSQSVSKLLGYTKEEFELNSVSYASCIHPEDLEKVMQEVTSNNACVDDFFVHQPYRIITKDGSIKWILDNTVVIKDEYGEITHYLGYLSDITELQDYQSELELLSKTDQLTKLKNRLSIDKSLELQHYRFQRDGELCSVIMIDIDFFKAVNDVYGHLVGDEVLKEFATLLKNNIRESDFIGRWGGEEFLIILPHTDIAEAVKSAQKLQNVINSYSFPQVGKKTASFGLSGFKDNMSIKQLLENVDEALYTSKNNGRNQITVK